MDGDGEGRRWRGQEDGSGEETGIDMQNKIVLKILKNNNKNRVMHTATKHLAHLRLWKHCGNGSSKMIRFRVKEKLTQNCVFLVTS